MSCGVVRQEVQIAVTCSGVLVACNKGSRIRSLLRLGAQGLKTVDGSVQSGRGFQQLTLSGNVVV